MNLCQSLWDFRKSRYKLEQIAALECKRNDTNFTEIGLFIETSRGKPYVL